VGANRWRRAGSGSVKQGFDDIHTGDNVTAHVGGVESTPQGKHLLAALMKVLQALALFARGSRCGETPGVGYCRH